LITVLPQDLEIVFYVNWLANLSDFLLHASGFVKDGKGFVFIGPSGAGKSTLVSSVAKDPSVTVIGEDQIIVRLIENKFIVYGTPWHENPDLCAPIGAPLTSLVFLNKGHGNVLARISPMDGMTRLLQTAFIPYYRQDCLESIIERMATLVSRIPSFTLSYVLGEDVLQLIQNCDFTS